MNNQQRHRPDGFRGVRSGSKAGLNRRRAVQGLAAISMSGLLGVSGKSAEDPHFRLCSFSADITPPVGGPLFNAVRARAILDPLQARGFVLSGSGKPIVLVAVDWCEIRNESYKRWRSALAHAARTDISRVLVSCVHQHDAPYTDISAQQLLKEHGVAEDLCDPKFEEQMIRRIAAALRGSLNESRRVTHIGTGQGKVDQVASNRRFVTSSGKVSFDRTSATRDPRIRAMPIGTIDPWLKTISFWEDEQPLAALSCYSVHPMAFYGKGDVSCDFPGIARAMRQQEMPSVAQIYCSGCSGDTVAGKFNDGSEKNRPILAGRLHQGMRDAWRNTNRHLLERIDFRSTPLLLEPRRTPGFSLDELKRILADENQSRLARFEAALGLSWRRRADAGHRIDVPAIDFGRAQIILLPAETFVQYQLWAQEMRPDSFVMTLGFGECAPGYIPTASAISEGYNDHYSWIAAPECEQAMRQALKTVLKA